MRIVLTVIRVLVGLQFLLAGTPKLLGGHSMMVENFTRWGLPAPDLFVYVVGIVEVVCGLALVLGVATRWAAIVLALNMVGAILTAGLVDGGIHLILPPTLGLLSALIAARGGGAWQLRPSLGATRGPSTG